MRQVIILTGDALKARLDICAACEHLRKAPIEHCGICHCPIKSKTRVARSSCPKGKWPKAP